VHLLHHPRQRMLLATSSAMVADPSQLEDTRHSVARARVGSTLRDKWHLNKLIAVGGMSAVYDGTHRNGMRGAVKILDPCLNGSVAARKRFLREGRLANRVRHPGAVRVLDDDEAADGTTYLVMELLTGVTLEALSLRTGGKLEAARAVELGLQIVDTLAEAHASGVVHRDIKPDNLLLLNDGTVKVLDFGIAGMLASDGSTTFSNNGDPIGTPAYMAPEQARGRAELVDQQSDLYCLGASLFSLLTGKLVHESGTMGEMLALTITKDAPSLLELMPSAPSALVRAIDIALKRRKVERFANAAAMRSALEEVYLALTGKRAPARRELSTEEEGVTFTPQRVRRLLATTFSSRGAPTLRWTLACIAIASVVGVTPASEAPPHRSLAAPERASLAAASASAAGSSANASPVTPRRYDAVYDRRH
jgi:serine/threonine protein kinase